jgi:type II secretory pathway component GspD/PulD (secretin)
VNPVENLDPADAGYGGSELLYFTLFPNDAASLLAAIDADSRNTVLTAPNVVAYSEQSVLHMVDDVEPSLAQIEESFRTNIQNVTQNPFGNFTGPVIDIVPRIANDNVTLDIRLGSEVVSFFLSTAFTVDDVPVDAEIPVLRRSTNMSSVFVPMGETVVIAGLLRQDATMADKGLPLLDDIPLIGSLFSRKHFDTEKQNLIIFVTATLVENN